MTAAVEQATAMARVEANHTVRPGRPRLAVSPPPHRMSVDVFMPC